MTGKLLGFILWSAMGIMMICFAIYSCFSKKPRRFWANTGVFEVTDIKKYNFAVAKLFLMYGIVLIVLGIPMLAENSAWIMFSVAGAMVESIIAMVVYSLVIEKRYKKWN